MESASVSGQKALLFAVLWRGSYSGQFQRKLVQLQQQEYIESQQEQHGPRDVNERIGEYIYPLIDRVLSERREADQPPDIAEGIRSEEHPQQDPDLLFFCGRQQIGKD